jgi:hypothetical protein
MAQLNWAEQLKAVIDSHPLVVLSTTVVGIIAIITTLSQALRKTFQYVRLRSNWKPIEEKTINSLTPGINIAKFQEVLGTHLFRRTSENGYIEYTYKRRGYWIQAITDQEASVVLYTVTSYDQGFKPRLKNNPIGVPIRLGTTTFKAAAGEHDPELHYFISGATANTYLMEKLYLGNPSHYQTVLWGYNDAGSIKLQDNTMLLNLFSYLQGREQPPSLQDAVVNIFRANNTFNTFAVSAPSIDISDILKSFQVGVDRIQTRIISTK